MTASERGEVARDPLASPEPAPFEPGPALDHVGRLSYPRRVGTRQERRAARYILGTLAALGLDWRRERFAVPHLAREIGSRVVLAAGAAAAVAGTRAGESWPLLAAICWGGAAVLVNAPWRLVRGFGSWWPARTASENLVASLPPDPDAEEAPARVVFMAHYDSKSQFLPTGLRVALVVAATALCALLALGALAASAGAPSPLPGRIAAGLSAIVVAALAALAANVTGNRSPGALDNGTGLGTLLELARTWRPRPEAPAEALWVATGSEELGLDGARDFLGRHEAWWREKPTLLINLDSVGAGDRLYLAGEPGALRLAAETAARLGLPWARLRVLGAAMDHEPFAARGLAALSLLGDVVGKSLVFHSSRDQIELVELPALDRAGRLAGQIAWAWAEQHQPEIVGADEPERDDAPVAAASF